MASTSFLHNLTLLPEHLSASDRNPTARTNFNLRLNHPILARLEQCTSMQQLRQLHAQMIITGLCHETFASSRLIAFCGLSLHGDLRYALKLFNQLRHPNLFVWNSMIRSFSRSNHPEFSLHLYVQMLEDGCCVPDAYTYPFLLKSCSHLSDSGAGLQVHAHVVKTGFGTDIFVSNSLVHMYAEFGWIEMAKTVFRRMPESEVALSAMIGGLVRNGCSEEAITLFRSTNWRECCLDQITIGTVLSACARLGDLKLGKEIHCYIEQKGVELGLVLSNSLLNMYAKCGELETALTHFNRMLDKDAVSWNVMIAGLAENGYSEESFELFVEMRSREVNANVATFLALVSSCNGLRLAKAIHGQIRDSGFESDASVCNAMIDMYSRIGHVADLGRQVFEEMRERDVVTWNSMIAGYTRCGSMGTARSLFDEMPLKDNFSWSTMILGFVRNDQPKEAIEIYKQLLAEGKTKPDSVTTLSVLTACSSLGTLEEGRAIHDYIENNDIEVDVPLATALIDMYSKCGCLEKAIEIFECMVEKDVLTWTALISGFAMNGNAEGALQLFREMQVKPNSVTFLAVLSACAHAGLVEEGKSVYRIMLRDQRLVPEMAHLGCMVDLLGRAGYLDEALEFILNCGYDVDVSVWGALLGACKIHRDVRLGEIVARKMIELEPMHDGAHVLMANMYAEAGQWSDRKELRRKMREEKIAKEVGMSWIELDGVLCEFAAGDNVL